MSAIKIGIVEDEIIIARTIEGTLDELGYEHCGPADSYGDAIKMIETEKPDLLLLDINLSGKKDGIHIAETVNEKYKIPFIFLTAFSDAATIERAKPVKPNAYIIKPFTKDELFVSIEIALSNFSSVKTSATPQQQQSYNSKDFAFYKDGQNFHKVFYADILYLESDNNYVTLFCSTNRKVIVRSAFSEILQSLPKDMFVQTHRSYAVNISKVTSVETLDVVVDDKKVPVSKSYREELLIKLGI